MSAKSERFELRIDADLLDRLDAWRSSEEDQPSRAEAIRRLVEAGLAHDNRGRVPHLTDGEKLITTMLVDLSKHLKVKGDINVDFVQKVIFGGHYWAFGWELPGLFHGQADRQARVRFVLDVLDMWFFIEEAMATFSAKDKKRIEKEADPFGKDVRYYGFDGNNEAEYLGIAGFLVEEMDRFAILKGRGHLNSHHPTLETYGRMLAAFKPMKQTIAGRNLSVNEVIALMKERVHPSRR